MNQFCYDMTSFVILDGEMGTLDTGVLAVFDGLTMDMAQIKVLSSVCR
jgi:hypothetical protein